jgi:periplasmic protein CpxP/Spy
MKRRAVFFGVLGTGALATLFGARAFSAGEKLSGMWQHHGFGHRGGGEHGFLSDPEQAKEHVSAMVSFALDGVDATDEQQQKVKAAMGAALEDVMKLRDRHHADAKALHEALSAAQVDRAAIERLRKSEIELFDQASSRILTALADAAETLTPEQRARVAERIHRMHH